MSITPPTGILDITDAIVRVSKLEFRGATGFDTILNNVARNTALLVDQNVEYTTDKAWGLKLPNAWVSEFDAYWASGASGNIDFNIYNNTTSGTNGYTISMDDTTITVKYDGGSALETVSLGSTLRNDTWRKIHILFERDMISLALDGTRVLYFKDTLIRPRVYDEESGYVIASGLSADRKVKNLRILNGDKWMTDNTSNIAFVHGNVGIGTTQAAYTLDVKGDIRATGNLLIEGLTTTVDTQNLSIEDAIVEIGRGNDGGTSGKDVGFLFTRNNGADTTNSNVALIYDESTDRLTFGYSDGSPTDSTLAINTSKSLDVVIPSGNLGIGTTDPGDKKLKTWNGDISASTTPVSFGSRVLGSGSSHMSRLEVREIPETSPVTWEDWSTRIQKRIDTTYQGYIEFNPPGGDYGLAFGNSGGGTPGEHMRILQNGNVGIGTTDPQGLLHISSGTSGDAHLILEADTDNNNETDNPKIVFRQDGGYYTGEIGLGNNQMVFRSKSTTTGNTGFIFYSNVALDQTSKTDLDDIQDTQLEVMRIEGLGNVGIGTNSPNSLLTFFKDYPVPTSGSEPAADVTQGITFRSDLNSFSAATSPAWNNTLGAVDVAKIWFQPRSYQGISGSAGVHGTLNFGTGYSGSQSSTPDMVINTEGNVGIGTTSPSVFLHIVDPNVNSTTELLRLEKANANGDINNASIGYIGMHLQDGNDGGGEVARISYGHTGDSVQGSGSGANAEGKGKLGFWTSDTGYSNAVPVERMTINHKGSVGIGTTNPNVKLDVNGIATFRNQPGFQAWKADFNLFDLIGSSGVLDGWTEQFDVNGDFNPTTGVFTAPEDGLYSFGINFSWDTGDGVDDTMWILFEVANNSTYGNRSSSTTEDFPINPRFFSRSSTEYSTSLSTLERLQSGATVNIHFHNVGSVKNYINATNFFGYKVS
jgi:hypothetical protein